MERRLLPFVLATNPRDGMARLCFVYLNATASASFTIGNAATLPAISTSPGIIHVTEAHGNITITPVLALLMCSSERPTFSMKGARRESGTNEEQLTVKSSPTPKLRRAYLKHVPSLPLDVLFEILQYVSPDILLFIARANKAWRRLLMSRSSSFIWKASRENYGIPPCPSYMVEPQYASLWFDNHCHCCLAPSLNIKWVLWEFRARYCRSCKYVMTTEDCAYKDLPSLHCMGLRAVYHVPDVENLTIKIASATLGDEVDEILVLQQVLTAEIVEHSEMCKKWLYDLKISRQKIRESVRQDRRHEITRRLEVMGWGDEIRRMGRTFYMHRLVRRPAALTERDWQKICPDLVKSLEASKAKSYIATLKIRFLLLQNIAQKHFLLQRAFDQATGAQYPPPDFLPHAIDLCIYPSLRQLLDIPLSIQVDTVSVDANLPGVIDVWRRNKIFELYHRFGSHFGPISTGVRNPLELAVVVFKCSKCNDILFYPNSLSHNCSFPQPWVDIPYDNNNPSYESVAANTFRRLPRSFANLEVTPWTQHAQSVVEACCMDPLETNHSHMDSLGLMLRCKVCCTDSLTSMDWRAAIKHSVGHHPKDDTSSLWETVPLLGSYPIPDIASLQVLTSPQVSWSCARCLLAHHRTEVEIRTHCVLHHLILPVEYFDYFPELTAISDDDFGDALQITTSWS